MKQSISFLNVLALCAALTFAAGCRGYADPDPNPDPLPEPPEVIDTHTTDLDFCIYSNLDEDILELLHSRFTGKQVPCGEAEVVFISSADIDSEAVWSAYRRGAVVFVTSPDSDLLTHIYSKNIGFLTAETVEGSLFIGFHRSGKVFSMDDFPPTNLNGLVLWVDDVNSSNSSGKELLQLYHLYSSMPYSFDKEIADVKKGSLRRTGNGSFEQYYSIIPLYAFNSERSNYIGDFYLVDATFSVASSEMYSGIVRFHQWADQMSDFMAFFLTGYKVEISLVDDSGAEVPAQFNQVPAPSTTINSYTYTSGVTWSFNAGLSGGAKGGEVSLSTGCSYSSSKTRAVRDLSIRDNSDANGHVSYALEIKNLPNQEIKTPPAISVSTFDFHCGWVWSVENTAEYDLTTHYRMKVTLSDMGYRSITTRPAFIKNWPVDKHEFFFDLPVPNRVPTGKVKFVNSEKGQFMTEIRFTNANDPTKIYFDASGSAYSYQQDYETSLPEGTYNVQYKLGGVAYTGSGIEVKRAETKEIQSGYYIK